MNIAWSAVGNHLWQSTLFAAAAWLIAIALRGNSAQARYRVWLAASLKFLVPFALLVASGCQGEIGANGPGSVGPGTSTGSGGSGACCSARRASPTQRLVPVVPGSSARG